MAYPMLARRAYGATGDGATLARPKWLGGGCHGLHSSSGMPRVEVNRTLCKVLALADAVTFAYLSRTGLCRRPVRRPIVQVLRTRTARERDHGRRRFSVSAQFRVAPLFCRPWTLNGISPRLIESHYEHNYGAALTRLNAVTRELEGIDFGTATPQAIGRLKREQIDLLNSTLL